jgi:hypothetical protein
MTDILDMAAEVERLQREAAIARAAPAAHCRD